MFRKLVINEHEHETRVALLEDGTIVELFVDRRDESDIAGNIYKGRIRRVLPGMQAAFVDIGFGQDAFIYVDDVLTQKDDEIKTRFSESDGNGDIHVENKDTDKLAYPEKRVYPIEDLIKEGQEILVHMAKSPMGTKGARATTYISLPGRYLVLMPFSNHIGVSRRIEDDDERNRLKNTITELRTNEYGYIVRTAGEGVLREKLAYEMGFLKNLWENIKSKYKTSSVPSILHKELNVSLRAVRDLLTDEAQRLITDSPTVYQSVLDFLDTFMPSLKDSVELYKGTEPVFDAFNLEGDISRALKRKVWLKSGGYIVIEQTEALVAIDVNTGRYVGKHNLDETILKTNLDAVKEIAYQIRLRDIGGIIIIDFIDMEKKSNQEKVFTALREALKKDRSKTHVLPISDIGLIQMTRKRIREPLTRIMCEPCFYCEGEGYLVSRQTVCYNIYREILRESSEINGIKITLKVNPEVAELLMGEENGMISSLESILSKHIVIYPDSDFHMEEFNVLETLKD